MQVESAIRSRVEAFATELVALIRASAVDMLDSALGARKAARGALPGRAALVPRAKSRPKGAKRDPNVLAALVDRLGQFIAKNPGQRIEQIGKALGVPTKDLVLPVKKLVADKRIKTKGEKRATTYFPGGAGKPAKAATSRKPQKRRRAGTTRTAKPAGRRKAKRRASPPAKKPSEPRAVAGAEPSASGA